MSSERLCSAFIKANKSLRNIVSRKHFINIRYLKNVLTLSGKLSEIYHLRWLQRFSDFLNDMKKKSLRLSSLIAVLATLSGCVTMKQFDEVQMDLDRIAEENQRLILSNQDGDIERRELAGRVEVLENSMPHWFMTQRD